MVLNTGARENDGRKLDHQTLEDIRMRSVDQIMATATSSARASSVNTPRSTTVIDTLLWKYESDAGRHAYATLVRRPYSGRGVAG